jgi:excisionase family DNA binding protein
MEQEWLTVAQVAELVQVHPETVREWLRTGRLRGHLISRRGGWRVRRAEVERFLGGGEAPDPGKAPAA